MKTSRERGADNLCTTGAIVAMAFAAEEEEWKEGSGCPAFSEGQSLSGDIIRGRIITSTVSLFRLKDGAHEDSC